MRFWILVLLTVSAPAHAVIYSYNNADGDYIVSQNKPTDRDISYAVLSDDGEYIRSVSGRKQQLPVGHWRPFWLPKEPHELDGRPDMEHEREPVVTIDELDED